MCDSYHHSFVLLGGVGRPEPLRAEVAERQPARPEDSVPPGLHEQSHGASRDVLRVTGIDAVGRGFKRPFGDLFQGLSDLKCQRVLTDRRARQGAPSRPDVKPRRLRRRRRRRRRRLRRARHLAVGRVQVHRRTQRRQRPVIDVPTAPHSSRRRRRRGRRGRRGRGRDCRRCPGIVPSLWEITKQPPTAARRVGHLRGIKPRLSDEARARI